MAIKKNFYAVKKGRHPGIYRTWDECKKNVDGFPGAVFKGFATKEEARQFLGKRSVADAQKQKISHPVSHAHIREAGGKTEKTEFYNSSISPEDGICADAYVDGSFDVSKPGFFSCGVVLLCNGKEDLYAARFFDPKKALMRNVAGEIEGAKAAIRLCMEIGFQKVRIFYDYMGIEAWCTGAWQAKNPYTQEYRDFFLESSQKIEVEFRKVKAHSGNRSNDKADRLAKNALEAKPGISCLKA